MNSELESYDARTFGRLLEMSTAVELRPGATPRLDPCSLAPFRSRFALESDHKGCCVIERDGKRGRP